MAQFQVKVGFAVKELGGSLLQRAIPAWFVPLTAWLIPRLGEIRNLHCAGRAKARGCWPRN